MDATATKEKAKGLPNPWAARRLGAAHGFPAAPSAGGGLAPAGIERRLPNRAEALWMRLRGGDRGMPPAAAAEALLAPPFAAQALLVELPDGGEACVTRSGADLVDMGFAGPGPVAPGSRADDAGLGVGARMAALALAAATAGHPLHLDSDFDPDIGGPRPAILFRAVALPFAPEPGSGLAGLAVALLSWRRLLSADETAELHRELRAAIDWMGRNSR